MRDASKKRRLSRAHNTNYTSRTSWRVVMRSVWFRRGVRDDYCGLGFCEKYETLDQNRQEDYEAGRMFVKYKFNIVPLARDWPL